MNDQKDPRTYALIGVAMEVHREKGCGFKEPVYQECFEIELGLQGISFEREKEFLIDYKGHRLKKTYQADFVCFGEVIVELKALNELASREESQVVNYLKASGLSVGLLINFGAESLQFKRIVCTH
ncbi:MAG: GxxExxY protein [Candidatus Brocadiae bacterium]|nr:GxxExxY protein [Candidatus Brocadiia bacterium]